MKVIVNEKNCFDYSQIDVGDLVVFYNHKAKKEIQNVYIICYNDNEDAFYLQNIDGTKSKLRYYHTIEKMLEFKKGASIVKGKNVTLEINRIFTELPF